MHLVVAIAAKSDEHIGILANLTGVLTDDAVARHLATTNDPNDIIDTLSGRRPQPAAAAETSDEQESVPSAAVLGISLITEGAISYAARDPLRTIPCLMVGSAVAAGLSMMFQCGLHVPHGGIFVLPIPNAVDNLGMYIIAILVGTVVTAGMLLALKKPLPKSAQTFTD